jgi:hypothetical protein
MLTATIDSQILIVLCPQRVALLYIYLRRIGNFGGSDSPQTPLSVYSPQLAAQTRFVGKTPFNSPKTLGKFSHFTPSASPPFMSYVLSGRGARGYLCFAPP